jgi:hypothetical protein
MLQLSPGISAAIMMNNYFHDVATAMLAASGAVLWVFIKKYEGLRDAEATDYFLRIYGGMTKVARFSLYWILLGGVPRTLFFRKYELANAIEHRQIPALIAKQLLALAFVVAGVLLWLKIAGKVKDIRERAS